jgi:hypothetical protein
MPTRIMKREQTSANRWYLCIKLTDPKQVDGQVAGWLARAFEMAQ